MYIKKIQREIQIQGWDQNLERKNSNTQRKPKYRVGIPAQIRIEGENPNTGRDSIHIRGGNQIQGDKFFLEEDYFNTGREYNNAK
jgi:hypothetical protein